MKKAPRLFLVAMLVSSLTACASSILGGTSRGGGYTDGSARPGSDVHRDRSIISAINSRYVKDELVNAFDVNVHSYQGTVTLSGTLASRRAVQRAVEIAWSVEGVQRVISKLTVASSPSR